MVEIPLFLKQVAMPKSQGAITRLASASQSESEPVLCNYGTLLNKTHTLEKSRFLCVTHREHDDDVNLHFKFTACAVTQSY